MSEASQKLVRFSFAERARHWMAALSFLYAALSGLALWSPHLFWLSSVLGGGETVRRWHPWGGVVFGVALGLMFRNWAREMKLDADDKVWLANAHKYAVHDEEGLPEPGRFNAGQKMLFWLQSLVVIVLIATGVVPLVSRSDAARPPARRNPRASRGSRAIYRWDHRPHLYGYGCRPRSVAWHDSRLGAARLGGVAPSQVVSRHLEVMAS